MVDGSGGVGEFAICMYQKRPRLLAQGVKMSIDARGG